MSETCNYDTPQGFNQTLHNRFSIKILQGVLCIVFFFLCFFKAHLELMSID